MARLIPLGESVTRGEQKMLDYLRRTLPGDWVVFGNPQVTTGLTAADGGGAIGLLLGNFTPLRLGLKETP